MIFDRRESFKITENFWSGEFYCKCGICARQIVEKELVERLEHLRNSVGHPLLVNSGYRCARHNELVGGRPNSAHLYGKAADISSSGLTGKEIAQHAERYFDRIGVADSWIHVDVLPGAARWSYPLQKHTS